MGFNYFLQMNGLFQYVVKINGILSEPRLAPDDDITHFSQKLAMILSVPDEKKNYNPFMVLSEIQSLNLK